MKRALVAIAFALFACSSASTSNAPKTSPCTETAGAFAPFSTKCGQLVDAQGRVVIFRGINARVAGIFDADLGAGKRPRLHPPDLPPQDLARMRRIGFGALRLPVHWSAIEPDDHDPPQYDEAYLSAIDAKIADAKSAHVKVLVDFHQDVYSKYIGQDGAPEWAVFPAPSSITDGPVDTGALLLTSQAQSAFQNFFSSTSDVGGKLRDRFARAVVAVMKRHVGDDAILGVDLYNEPLASMDDLRAFHEQVGAAVRAVDAQRLIFFEPNALRNLLDSADLASKPLSLDGVVYAPHVYTHVFTQGDDSQWRSSFTLDDLRPSNESARQEADSWHAPLFVGEFGWGPNDARFADYVGWQLDLQDELMASSTIWLWKEQDESTGGGAWGLFDRDATTGTWSERASARRVFARVFPEAIGGWPESWRWDANARRFTLTLIGVPSVTAPTLLHLPLAEDAPGTFVLTCDGKTIDATPDDDGVVSIACNGEGEHVVVAQEQGA